ncbi:MAG: DUF448 domain-containing protein [Alphaproteobacteria bacterium]|nr:DUF448 domain-containing protein [Alphaproteobacteria bacterium]
MTGETYPVHRLIRFVVDPEGRVIPDVAAKLPGRGGWLLAEGKIVEMAIKKKILVRFGHRVIAHAVNNAQAKNSQEDEKTVIRVADTLPELVVKLLRQRCLDYLGFANRAGLVVSGFEKVRARLRSGKCRVLITAEDAAADGRRKICTGLGNILDNLRMIDMFTREQLGQALGLSNAVHVALGSGGITESFMAEFSRYESVILR